MARTVRKLHFNCRPQAAEDRGPSTVREEEGEQGENLYKLTSLCLPWSTLRRICRGLRQFTTYEAAVAAGKLTPKIPKCRKTFNCDVPNLWFDLDRDLIEFSASFKLNLLLPPGGAGGLHVGGCSAGVLHSRPRNHN